MMLCLQVKYLKVGLLGIYSLGLETEVCFGFCFMCVYVCVCFSRGGDFSHAFK